MMELAAFNLAVYAVPVVPGRPGADERLVRPSDVEPQDKSRVIGGPWSPPVALGVWPLQQRADGYAAD